VLCATEGYKIQYANVWIEGINFVSIRCVDPDLAPCPRLTFRSIALYGLLVFYGLMAEELKGKRPVAKFLSIKLIVMFTFYQTFVVCICLFLFVAWSHSCSSMHWRGGSFTVCHLSGLQTFSDSTL